MADVRVTDLTPATSLASGDVLHGVQAADSADKKFSLTDLSTYFAGGSPVQSVFGRTGTVVATNGDYDIGELGDVDLSVAPTSGQFLKWNGSNWIADNVPADVVDLGYTTAASTGTVTNTAGTDATIPAATTSLAGLLTATDKTKLDGIATGAQPGTVTSIATTAPITGGTITGSGTIGIDSASTSQSGAVQLTDSTSSTSTTTAATPNSVKTAYDLANAALPTAGGTLTGGVYQTLRTITDNTAWDLSTGNQWIFAGGTIANPSNATAGMSGLIYASDPITGWGTNFDFPGGTTLAPSTYPAIIPFFVQAANVIKLGNATEGIV